MKQKRPRPVGGCTPPGDGKEPQTYAEVVATYLAEDRERGNKDLAWFAQQPDAATLLEKAVMSRTRQDQRHPHQRRIPESVLRAAHRALSRCNLGLCQSFDQLHDLIESSTSRIAGIGPLAVYDFASRIGAKQKLHPKKVYLHSGTRVGARALGLGRGRKTIEVHELPEEFHCLSARHAEDCLCIHKDALRRIASRNRR